MTSHKQGYLILGHLMKVMLNIDFSEKGSVLGLNSVTSFIFAPLSTFSLAFLVSVW